MNEPQRIAAEAARRRGAGEVRPAGAGTEFAFFTTDDGEGYRVPRNAVFHTVNNPDVESGGLQEKERSLMLWAAAQGIPAAQVHDLIEIEGIPVLVVAVVDDDGSDLDGRTFGQLIARLHQAPAPAFAPAAQGQDIADLIEARLIVRSEALRRYGLPKLPAQLAEAIRAGTGQAVVNHLDLRRQNVRCANGVVRALFDWSNVLLAPVELELARLTEYAEIPANGLDLGEILAGYCAAGGTVADQTERGRCFGWTPR